MGERRIMRQAEACGNGVDKVPRLRSGLCRMASGDAAVSGVSIGPVPPLSLFRT